MPHLLYERPLDALRNSACDRFIHRLPWFLLALFKNSFVTTRVTKSHVFFATFQRKSLLFYAHWHRHFSSRSPLLRHNS